MGKWDVSGANRETGEAMRLIVEAATEQAAVRCAGENGMLIESITPYQEPPPQNGKPAPVDSAVAEQLRYTAGLANDHHKWYEDIFSVLFITIGPIIAIGAAANESPVYVLAGLLIMLVGFLIRINGKLRLIVQKQIMLLTMNYNSQNRSGR